MRPRPLLVAAGLALLALALYVRTLAPSIFWGDSPELTSAAYNLGVAHPTGYPVYTMLGHLFTRLLPFGEVAWRMNLLSALSAAGAIALVFLLLLCVVRRALPAALGALLFAVGRTFWSQAVIAEVYAFHGLCVALVLFCALTWDRTGEARWLRLTALAYGLALAHHLQSVLLAPGLAILILGSPRRGQFWRELRWTLPLGLFPLLAYGYLPYAAWRDAPENWNDPRTLSNLWKHVSGWEYRDLMFSKTPVQWGRDFWRYGALPLGGSEGGFLFQQAGWAPPALALLGIRVLWRTHRRLLLATAAVYGITVGYALNYRIFDIDSYYLAAHLMVALWAACGARQLLIWLARLWRRTQAPAPQRTLLTRTVAGALIVLLPGGALSANWHVNDLSRDTSALNYARAAAAALKPHSLVFATGDFSCFPLLYALNVERRRPDVAVVVMTDLLYPHRARLLQRLRAQQVIVNLPPSFTAAAQPAVRDSGLLEQLVADNIRRRPVYLAIEPERIAELKWVEALDRRYFRVTRSNFFTSELLPAPPDLTPQAPVDNPGVRFGTRETGTRLSPGIALAGYTAQPIRQAGARWLRVRYHWRREAGALPACLQVMTLFADAEGNYERPATGPIFHSEHVLGQAVGPRPIVLPTAFTETLDMLVPPEQWNRPLTLWVALAEGERFLASDGGKGYVALGPLPSLASDGASRLALGRR